MFNYTQTCSKSYTDIQTSDEEIKFEKLPIVIPRNAPQKRIVEFVARKIPNAISCPNLASMSGSLFSDTMDIDNPFGGSVSHQNQTVEEGDELFNPFGELSPSKQIFKRAKLNKTVSCPDLSYMKATKAKILKEDERRERRLARNRESARLRRLRKKTVVEHLQLETHAMDEMMKKLKIEIMGAQRYNAHPTGPSNRKFAVNARPLISTFGPCNRSFKTSPYRRLKNMEYILEESITEVDMLDREIMYPLRVLEQVLGADTTSNETRDGEEEEEFDALDIIDRAKQMTMQSPEQNRNNEVFVCEDDEQRSQIMALSRAIEIEVLMLRSIRKCFEYVQYKKWHALDTVDKWNENFLSVLSLEQAKKYLSWCRKNYMVISSASIDVPRKGSFKK